MELLYVSIQNNDLMMKWYMHMFEKGLHLMSSFLDGPVGHYQGIRIFVSWPLMVIEAFLIV